MRLFKNFCKLPGAADLLALGIIFALTLLLPARAQAATTPATASATPPAAASTGAPAAKLFAQVYGSWIYRCLETPANATCSVQQQLVLNQNSHRTVLLTLTFLHAAKSHVMNIMVPLGVALKPGVALIINAAKPVGIAYNFCSDNGCFALDQPASSVLKAARGGNKGQAVIGLMNGKSLAIVFPLKGLTEAMAALDSGILPKQQANITQ